MTEENKRKLRLITIVYWVLLSYIIAALIWWALSLMKQNETLYEVKKENLSLQKKGSIWYQQQLREIEEQRKRNIYKYIGEGGTFFILIIIGAAFVYRSVRRQFKVQQQQQNFMMAVTHELKTPLSVSRLNLETLQKYALDEEKKRKLLQMTLQETLRLDTLINNILISSQLDGNSYKLSKEEINFSDLTNDMLHQFSNRYPERIVNTTIEEDAELNGDPLLLKLLISNLLENANKYASKEKPILVQLKKKKNAVLLEVTDQGPGIADQEKKDIFKKFYRIGNEQTRKTQGTGLGLYLCKKIAADHRGTITVTDNQPQGCNFIVHFPV